MTPVYDGEGFVARCYRNLLSQDFTEWEWVVVDDGSTDNTLQELQAIAAADARVIITTYTPNRGRGFARNTAIAKARGDWVVVWDVDDLHYPERLTEIEKARLGDYDYCCSYAVVVDNALEIKGVRGFGAPSGCFGREFVHPTLACKRELMAKIGYRETKGVGGIGEDVLLGWILPKHYKGLYHEEALSIYQEDRGVNLRKATDSNLAQLSLLMELASEGEITRDSGYMFMFARYAAKICVLYLLRLAPKLYLLTVRARSGGSTRENWTLAASKIALLAEWRGMSAGDLPAKRNA